MTARHRTVFQLVCQIVVITICSSHTKFSETDTMKNLLLLGITSFYFSYDRKVVQLTKVASVSIASLPYNNLLCDVVIINSPIISTNIYTQNHISMRRNNLSMVHKYSTGIKYFSKIKFYVSSKLIYFAYFFEFFKEI